MHIFNELFVSVYVCCPPGKCSMNSVRLNKDKVKKLGVLKGVHHAYSHGGHPAKYSGNDSSACPSWSSVPA